MPIYTYRCKSCNVEEDAMVSVSHRDDPRTHSCGRPMKRVLSIPLPPIMRQTGKDMALETLNSGQALPNRWYKSKYEKLAAKGLERPPKEIW